MALSDDYKGQVSSMASDGGYATLIFYYHLLFLYINPYVFLTSKLFLARFVVTELRLEQHFLDPIYLAP